MVPLFKFNKGQALIEVVVTMGLAAVMLPALLTGLIATRSGLPQQTQRTQATALATEAAEVLRIVREAGWAAFAVNGIWHPVRSGNTWTLASGSESIQGFTRLITIADAFRDSSGKLVTSGGNVDPSTKLVTVTVSWLTPLPTSVTTTYYMTRYLDNLAWIQTTQEDFTAGVKAGTAVANNSGGEVVLGAGGQGDWCAPNLTISAQDLPKSGVANALSAIEGHAFAGTGDNASGISYANVSITNATPPQASITNPGTFDGFKTNDIFGEANYAYLATDNNAKEIEIINLTTNPYSEAGYFDAPGNGNGNSVYASATVGYMTSGNKFYTFDLASKSGSRPPLGSVDLAGTGKRMVVVGTYAYVAVDSTSTQMQIIDVSNPSSPAVVGQASVNGQGGVALATNGPASRVYIATAASASQAELFIVDTSAKTGDHSALGSYDTNGMDPRSIAIATANKAIIVGHSAEEYQVVGIISETSPTRCGGINIDTGVNGVATVVEQDGDAYSYIITGDAGAEFRIIAGGPGGQFATSGTFTSSIFDSGYSTAFNYVSYTATLPSSTSVQLQVAGADPVSDSCTSADYVFVGPDGTSGTFFTPTGSQIPISDDGTGFENPARCFRYKAFLSTSDPSQTPELNDVTINYSP